MFESYFGMEERWWHFRSNKIKLSVLLHMLTVTVHLCTIQTQWIPSVLIL